MFYRAVQRWPEKLSGVRIYICRWEIKRRNFATKTDDFDVLRCLHLGVSIKCLYWDYLCYLLTNYNNRCDDDDESVD